MAEQQLLKVGLILLAAVALLYILYDYNKQQRPGVPAAPGMETYAEAPKAAPAAGAAAVAVQPSEAGANSSYKAVNFGAATAAPKDCFPRDNLPAEDLLPKDAANSKWAQVVPAGQGSVGDQNLLTAGYHVGINTVGSSLRNANLQLRSDPPNPQMNVGPWMQSTIEPDISRRALEIGGDC